MGVVLCRSVWLHFSIASWCRNLWQKNSVAVRRQVPTPEGTPPTTVIVLAPDRQVSIVIVPDCDAVHVKFWEAPAMHRDKFPPWVRTLWGHKHTNLAPAKQTHNPKIVPLLISSLTYAHHRLTFQGTGYLATAQYVTRQRVYFHHSGGVLPVQWDRIHDAQKSS